MAAALQSLRLAVAQIIGADGPTGTAGTVQNLCARSTDVVREERSLGEYDSPIVVYACEYAGYGTPESEIKLAASASGAGAPTTVTDLLQRCITILTAVALKAAGIDASPAGEPIWEELDTTEDSVSPAAVIGSVRIPLRVFA